MATNSQGRGQMTYVTTAEYDAATLPEVVRGRDRGQAPWGPEDIQQPDAQEDHQLPQAIPSEYQHERALPQLVPETDLIPNVQEKTGLDEGSHQVEARRPWWRKRLFLLIAFGVIVVVGLVLGLAIGLTRKGANNAS